MKSPQHNLGGEPGECGKQFIQSNIANHQFIDNQQKIVYLEQVYNKNKATESLKTYNRLHWNDKLQRRSRAC